MIYIGIYRENCLKLQGLVFDFACSNTLWSSIKICLNKDYVAKTGTIPGVFLICSINLFREISRYLVLN